VYNSRSWKQPECRGVRIVIADNGSGILPQNRQQLFRPFFTTKGEKGTGLGLWVTQGIVRKHGGFIRVRSNTAPGRNGTCFCIFIPVLGQDDRLLAISSKLAS
jgi:two-component system, NtrC family, sensor kinase